MTRLQIGGAGIEHGAAVTGASSQERNSGVTPESRCSAPEPCDHLTCPNCDSHEVGTFTANQWFLYTEAQIRLLAKDVKFFRCMSCALEFTGEDGEKKRLAAVNEWLTLTKVGDVP